SSRRRHTRFSRDWSSDVCSSDLFNNQGDLNSGSSSSRGAVLVPARRLDAKVIENGVEKTQRQLLLDRVNKITMKTSTPTAKSYRSEERRVGKVYRSRWTR